MKVICCGCGKELGEKGSSTSASNDEVSHGLCKPCSIRFKAELGVSLDEYVDSIPVPTVVVAEDGSINAANSSAQLSLEKSLNEICGERLGMVFECSYAQRKEGCGDTVFCSGCTIRATVLHTMETGNPIRFIPASLRRGSSRVDLLISTEKKGGVVFLQVISLAPAHNRCADITPAIPPPAAPPSVSFPASD